MDLSRADSMESCEISFGASCMRQHQDDSLSLNLLENQIISFLMSFIIILVFQMFIPVLAILDLPLFYTFLSNFLIDALGLSKTEGKSLLSFQLSTFFFYNFFLLSIFPLVLLIDLSRSSSGQLTMLQFRNNDLLMVEFYSYLGDFTEFGVFLGVMSDILSLSLDLILLRFRGKKKQLLFFSFLEVALPTEETLEESSLSICNPIFFSDILLILARICYIYYAMSICLLSTGSLKIVNQDRLLISLSQASFFAYNTSIGINGYPLFSIYNRFPRIFYWDFAADLSSFNLCKVLVQFSFIFMVSSNILSLMSSIRCQKVVFMELIDYLSCVSWLLYSLFSSLFMKPRFDRRLLQVFSLQVIGVDWLIY